MRTRSLALLAAVLLPLAACGDDRVDADPADTTPATAAPSTTSPAPTVALRVETVGGCEMRGPNCPTYVVWTDGTVEISRTGQSGGPEVTGSIPASAVTALVERAATTDFATLADRVGPGECQACVDGIDLTVTLALSTGDVTLDSTEVAFDPAEPLFADLDALMNLVRGAGELPIVER